MTDLEMTLYRALKLALAALQNPGSQLERANAIQAATEALAQVPQ